MGVPSSAMKVKKMLSGLDRAVLSNTSIIRTHTSQMRNDQARLLQSSGPYVVFFYSVVVVDAAGGEGFLGVCPRPLP